MSIHEKEDNLFGRWIDYYKSLFCWDGLHRTGTPTKENGYWELVPDNQEESIWESSPLRCIFLTKDYYHQGDYEGIDIREEVGCNNKTDSIYYPFHRMYLMLLYGIMHIDLDTFKCPDIECANNEEVILDYFLHAPVVRINTKKLAGLEQCPKPLLQAFVHQDSELLKEQIDIYDGNIIICCDGNDWNIGNVVRIVDSNNPILEMLREKYPDLKQYSGWIYFSEKEKVIILHEYHPSSQGMSYEKFYEGTSHIAEFLSKHTDFLRYSHSSSL